MNYNEQKLKYNDRMHMSIGMCFITFWTLVVLFNPDWGANRFLYWGSIAVFVGGSLVLSNKKIHVRRFVKWLLCFTLLCTMSILWAKNITYSFDYLKSMYVNLIILVLLSQFISSMDDINKLLVVIFSAICFMAVYLLFNVDWQSVGNNRLGTDYTGAGWNANTIGMMMIWGVGILIYLINQKIFRNGFIKLGGIGILALFGFILIATGSRKAILGLALLLVGYWMLLKRNRIVFRLIIGIALLAFCIYLVLNVPYLYEHVGYRMEGLIGLFNKSEMVDHSTYLREWYSQICIEQFKERPLIGYGINNARYFIGAITGDYTYAHNNYSELLVDIGIVGVTLFYYAYLTYVVKIFRISSKKTYIDSFLITSMICSCILQYGYIAYTDLMSLLILMMSGCYLDIYYYNKRMLRKKQLHE